MIGYCCIGQYLSLLLRLNEMAIFVEYQRNFGLVCMWAVCSYQKGFGVLHVSSGLLAESNDFQSTSNGC